MKNQACASSWKEDEVVNSASASGGSHKRKTENGPLELACPSHQRLNKHSCSAVAGAVPAWLGSREMQEEKLGTADMVNFSTVNFSMVSF